MEVYYSNEDEGNELENYLRGRSDALDNEIAKSKKCRGLENLTKYNRNKLQINKSKSHILLNQKNTLFDKYFPYILISSMSLLFIYQIYQVFSKK